MIFNSRSRDPKSPSRSPLLAINRSVVKTKIWVKDIHLLFLILRQVDTSSYPILVSSKNITWTISVGHRVHWCWRSPHERTQYREWKRHAQCTHMHTSEHRIAYYVHVHMCNYAHLQTIEHKIAYYVHVHLCNYAHLHTSECQWQYLYVHCAALCCLISLSIRSASFVFPPHLLSVSFSVIYISFNWLKLIQFLNITSLS